MSKTNIEKLKVAVDKNLADLGKLRDNLEEILNTAQEQLDITDRAIGALEEAKDAISEIV